MRVVSNHRYEQNLGGYSVYFVGIGERRMDFKGWWKTKLDFYSLDAVGFSQEVRVKGRHHFVRGENTVSLFADNVLYEELYEEPRKFEDAWIVFRPAGTSHPLKSIVGRRGYCLFRDDHRLIRQRIAEVANIASPDEGLRLLAQSAFLQILAHFCQAHQSARGDEPVIRTVHASEARGPTMKSRIVSILKSDLRKNVSVGELAEQLAVSRSTLSHRFSSEMGETMVQMKNRLRIQRAQELMTDPSKQLKEIAFEVGFDDPAYFTRLFTKMTGTSPSAYRQVFGRSGSEL